MLEEIIKELTVTSNDDHITSGGVLAWVKRVEVQRAQAVVLNTLTELRQFNRRKVSKWKKEDPARAPVGQTLQWQPCWYCGRVQPPRQCPVYGQMFMGCDKMGHFKKVCCSKRSRAVNEIELETSQEHSKGEIETVSINSVHMNKNWLLLMVQLKKHAGNSKIIILYKIDTGSEGNIMLWHIFKRLFKNVTEAELKKTVKGHIKLKTYNKTVIHTFRYLHSNN